MLPGFLIIDTPGHASFTNLRTRGSSLCDIAILVIDVNKSIQAQTIESINLLRSRGTPFVVALNQIDRVYGWESTRAAPIRESIDRQDADVKVRVADKVREMTAALATQELNGVVYWENKNADEYVSMIPTSAITGEGICDMLLLMTQMCQRKMSEQLTLNITGGLQCTVLEVKQIEGLGFTIDVILVNGILHEGDKIVLCGLHGPIVTNIRALLTPHPMKESRVKGAYVKHREVKAAMGVKIVATGLEHCIAGGSLLVADRGADLEELKDEAMGDLQTVLSRVDTSGQGVYVVASTLGSLEALLAFLEESKVPVSGIAIGDVHKVDVIKASVQIERKRPEFATILAFDVKVSAEASDHAERLGVKIFTAQIIYHLFDQMTKYLADVKEERRLAVMHEAVFPCVLDILPDKIFHNKDPIIMGVTVVEGVLKIGTPVAAPNRTNASGLQIMVGSVSSIVSATGVELKEAKEGMEVCVKFEAMMPHPVMLGRQFEVTDRLYSKITRRSIDVLKLYFKEEVDSYSGNKLWLLLRRLKRVFGVD
jgi:translation initiation factor 5B